ncbi:hypothetical protein ANCCEY_01229 [Ancylostoma ceylanicum]|uniref:Uncharacterized protein n=1 Tax=Ancylostoma ceylanicum TaxID=53326 RepID=A0A0D6M6D4_9BILA|nr:hypothetical protein ANCCEY_01229 [Ancylostoma ceylanicum]
MLNIIPGSLIPSLTTAARINQYLGMENKIIQRRNFFPKPSHKNLLEDAETFACQKDLVVRFGVIKSNRRIYNDRKLIKDLMAINILKTP